MHEPSKALKRAIRQLADIAYERELASALEALHQQFSSWRNGELDPFELTDAIHRFHNGIARDLYKQYASGGILEAAVAGAIIRGTISAAEIPEVARERLARLTGPDSPFRDE
ncbi:MAG TPA: hypothetical protein VE974_28725 [Thermoanaerobaculia bacterium]|nr:hypothetical protein [Thermoanaerobaculia bacterium]